MSVSPLLELVGPRIPRRALIHRPVRYALPAACLTAAAVLLLVSISLPWWYMTLRAPQYPKGLRVVGYVSHLKGDVAEIDELNHYIGMFKLNDAAQVERAIAVPTIIAFAALLLLAAFVFHTRWAALLALPAALFPAGFLIDLHMWLRYAGTHLDPHAPLSSSIKPFVPPVLGTGLVGQFKTIAAGGNGLLLASIAAGLIVAGLWFHRAAFKPLVEARRNEQLDEV